MGFARSTFANALRVRGRIAFGLLVSGLLLGVAGSLFANDPVDSVYAYSPVGLMAWSDQLNVATGGAIHSADYGDLNGDELQDVAVIRNAQAVYICGPGNYEAMHESTLPGAVADLAIVRWAGMRDVLFTVGPLGLREHPIDTQTNTFSAPNVVSAAWSSVTKLRVRGGSNGVVTLCGVDAGGYTVRTMGLIPGLGVVTQTSFSSPQPVLDVALVRAPGAPYPRVSLLRGDGVTFHDAFSPLPELSPIIRSAQPYGAICTFTNTGSDDADLTAWVTLNPAGTKYLLLLVDEGGVVYGTVPMEFPPHFGHPSAPVDVLGLRAGDVDGDGFSDLLVSGVGAGCDYIVWNQASVSDPSPVFLSTPGKYHLIDLAPGSLQTTSADASVALLGDFDVDGRMDYLRPLAMTDGIYVRPLQPMPDGMSWVAGNHLDITMGDSAPLYEFGGDGPNGVLHLQVEMPDAPPFDPTHVEVILWSHPDAAALGSAVTGDAIANDVYRLVFDGSTPAPVQQIAIPIPETGEFHGTYYYVELRLIRIVDELTQPIAYTARGGPESCALYVSSEFDMWDDYLVNHLPRSGPTIPLEFSQGPGAPLPGTALVGAVGPLVRLPYFTEADQPKPGPINPQFKNATAPPQ